jgi:hypothetical protein
MMSGQPRQPLNHLSNAAATPGTSGYHLLQSNFSSLDLQEMQLNAPPDHHNPTNDDDKENESLSYNYEESDEVIGETPATILDSHV